MTRPITATRLLHVSLVFFLVLSVRTISGGETKRPNVVLIMADDMGYECVGANGGTSYKTPRIDALARDGVRFENCHSQPICTPSRVQLMTGIYNQRNYIRFGLLDPKARTFAHSLKDAGYKTCIIGKWQLGGGVDGPKHFGFDEHCLWQLTVRKSRYPNPVIEQNGKTISYTNGEYGPDVVTDFGVDFLRRNRDEPFLLYYPMILPHWPFEPTPDSSDWDSKAEGVLKGQGKPHYFGDMVAYTDKMVGKLLDALDSLALRENTLVLFTGDNGTATSVRSVLNGVSIRGGKGKTTDAGTHVPFVASWPGVVPRGKVSTDLVDFSDFFPTLADATGAALPEGVSLDGRSFLPRLRGEAGAPREWIYCWYARNGGPKGAELVRDQRFKLYSDGRFYDVAKDRLESRNLARAKLDSEADAALKRLKAAFEPLRGTRRNIPKNAGKPKKAKSSKKQNTGKKPKNTGKKPKNDGKKPQESRSASSPEEAAAALRKIGGHVFLQSGQHVEVVLNRTKIDDETLRLVAALEHLTDVSLEETAVTDSGIAHIAGLKKLEWLNLYRTRVGDAGLARLKSVSSLRLLPIGETKVSDAGLLHIASLTGLTYLGLRGNDVSDKGVLHLSKLVRLEGLHLGETKITDAAVAHLAPLTKLQKLWLDQTTVSDASIPTLAGLASLRELHIVATKITAAGAGRLRAALPRCKVVAAAEDRG